jgi:hypothetical protein
VEKWRQIFKPTLICPHTKRKVIDPNPQLFCGYFMSILGQVFSSILSLAASSTIDDKTSNKPSNSRRKGKGFGTKRSNRSEKAKGQAHKASPNNQPEKEVLEGGRVPHLTHKAKTKLRLRLSSIRPGNPLSPTTSQFRPSPVGSQSPISNGSRNVGKIHRKTLNLSDLDQRSPLANLNLGKRGIKRKRSTTSTTSSSSTPQLSRSNQCTMERPSKKLKKSASGDLDEEVAPTEPQQSQSSESTISKDASQNIHSAIKSGGIRLVGNSVDFDGAFLNSQRIHTNSL